MGRETDSWPLVRAKYFRKWSGMAPRRAVRVIVIHDMEYPERKDTAQEIAQYFATLDEKDAQGNPIQKSAHVCVDADSIVQCVKDNDIAYAAPGCNKDGIQIELAGFARQTREQWLDEYSVKVLDLGANAAAQYCVKYDIKPVRLSDAQLLAGQKGIIGHAQASGVYKKSVHNDPGANFPWDVFMAKVGRYYHIRATS